jgi:chromosome partitioning protein
MRILSFSTHKGGTGKTTSSINLAAKLGRDGHRTLLIDMDPQGHATLGVGLDLAYDEPNIADVLTDRGVPLGEIIRPTDIPNLMIAPSNIRLASVAESLYAKMRREERLQKNLTAFQEPFEWVVIDCPPALGILTANALEASEIILIPCQMGARALDGLGDLLDVVRVLKEEDFTDWWIVLTMFDPRKKVTQEIFETLLTPYRDKVLHTQIFATEALNQAQMARQDIFTFDPKGRGTRDYEALAQEVLQRYP